MNGTVCGFYAVNGQHCIINSHCVVCKAPEAVQLKKGQSIKLVDFGGLDGEYLIKDTHKGVLRLELIK